MEIMTSSIKERLWHDMRKDLSNYIPEILEADLLMCCACARFLRYHHFNLEHIVPRQSLADDPAEVKNAVPANIRSGNILLCNKPLMIKGRTTHGSGCNSFKGKYYDGRLREVFNRSVFKTVKFDSRHHISIFVAGYLAMVSHYGYQVALIESGLLLRKQFFSPQKFSNDLPTRFQMVLFGDKPTIREASDIDSWRNPFSFSIERGGCFIVMRGISITLPISRDPNVPIARTLPFAPSKFTLRPDFTTFFD